METLSTAAGEKKKRRITESRRRQGREAQKRYREKRKLHQDVPAITPPSGPVDRNSSSANNDADTRLVRISGETRRTHAAHLDSPWSIAEGSQRSGAALDGVLDVPFPPASPVQRARSASSAGRRASQEWTFMDGIQSLIDAPAIPMDSYIRVKRLSAHAACIQNAYILGITWVKIEDHTCGDGKLPSPWIVQLPGYKTIASSSMEASTPELVPTPSQLLHPHDLYIDVLPFPEFREKLIEFKATAPRIFDENELVFDLSYRDAMQCWGPTPWESKSWEVQKWFLKKWWMITGGEHGEMAKSSRWWRMLRGEMG